MAHPIRNYAKLVLKTLGARGLTYLGDFSQGMDILRTATITFMREIPGMTRATVSRQLGVSLRTVAEWSRLGRETDLDDDSLEPSPTREGRIFMEIMQFLHRNGDTFVSLGRIAEHVKSTVDRRLTTMEIGKRMETYARLDLVENAQDETDAYRLTVCVPTRMEPSHTERAEMLAYVLSVVFDIGYQVYACDEDSHARIEVLRIPRAHRREFVQAVQEGIRDLSMRINTLEEELLSRSPGDECDDFKMIYLLGPSKLETTSDKLENIMRRLNLNGEEP